MMPIERCPVCGGNVVEKEVVEVLRGGDNTAILTVNAIVCQRCGERFYSLNTVRKFEDIKNKLERQETEEFQPVGQSFRVTSL